eukprot:jgi/Chrzof1/7420/Cz02g23020.t1
MAPNPIGLPIAIIGAGFSGLGMGIQLKKAGIDSFTIFEAADDVGGTWRDNTYPGCACDIKSYLYCYSFEPNPTWSKPYPSQPEILQYLHNCVDKHQLKPHIQLNAAIVEARFDETSGIWHLSTHDGRKFQARVVIVAKGALTKPKVPALPGIDTFQGTILHSARWDPSIDLSGKRVAVVGTGASSVQMIPAIQPLVKQLVVFQRSAPWVFPRPNKPFSAQQRMLAAVFPLFMKARRFLIYLQNELIGRAFYAKPERLRDAEGLAKAHMESQVSDPQLREKLTPQYRLGCKRVCVSDDYYPALCQSNVNLVASPVVEMRSGSVVAADGSEHEVDAIVFGTGFDVARFLEGTAIHGLGGRELNQQWREKGAQAYYGLAVSGYPNMFMLLGPNSGLGHNSVVVMIECQVKYVVNCIQQLLQRKLKWLDVKPGCQQKFKDEVDAMMVGTVWQSGCSSWYLTPEGKSQTLWPRSTWEYWWRLWSVKLSDWQLGRW